MLAINNIRANKFTNLNVSIVGVEGTAGEVNVVELERAVIHGKVCLAAHGELIKRGVGRAEGGTASRRNERPVARQLTSGDSSGVRECRVNGERTVSLQNSAVGKAAAGNGHVGSRCSAVVGKSTTGDGDILASGHRRIIGEAAAGESNILASRYSAAVTKGTIDGNAASGNGSTGIIGEVAAVNGDVASRHGAAVVEGSTVGDSDVLASGNGRFGIVGEGGTSTCNGDAAGSGFHSAAVGEAAAVDVDAVIGRKVNVAVQRTARDSDAAGSQRTGLEFQ